MGGVRTNLPRGETYLPLFHMKNSGWPNLTMVTQAKQRISGALAQPLAGR